MICGMSFYQICFFFLIYSVIGWIIEVAYHAVTLGKVVNRGFLNGPLCPVYGFGMLAVLAITYFIPKNAAGQTNTLLLFLAGMTFTTFVELIAGWILDKAFHARWWDYSDVPMNLHGYICVKFSIIWGLAVLFAVKFYHPLIEKLTTSIIPAKLGWIILAISYAIIFADFGITVAIVQGFNKELKRLDDLQKAFRKPSDKMSEYIAGSTLKITNSVEEFKKQKEQKFEELFTYKKWGTRRLLNAFPKMKHSKYAETLQEIKNYLQSHTKKHKDK